MSGAEYFDTLKRARLTLDDELVRRIVWLQDRAKRETRGPVFVDSYLHRAEKLRALRAHIKQQIQEYA